MGSSMMMVLLFGVHISLILDSTLGDVCRHRSNDNDVTCWQATLCLKLTMIISGLLYIYMYIYISIYLYIYIYIYCCGFGNLHYIIEAPQIRYLGKCMCS